MVLVFCRGGEVAGRERGEGFIDQKRERERSTSQHENRLVPRLLKTHSHRLSMLSILTPYGIGGTNRFMGMDHVSPGQEILQRGKHPFKARDQSQYSTDRRLRSKVTEYRWRTTISNPTCDAEHPLQRRDETTSRV